MVSARRAKVLAPCAGLFTLAALSLSGCAGGGFPESGFVTRSLTGWDEAAREAPTLAAEETVEAPLPPRDSCRALAEQRVADDALTTSFGLTAQDRQKIYDLTYADCRKWRGK